MTLTWRLSSRRHRCQHILFSWWILVVLTKLRHAVGRRAHDVCLAGSPTRKKNSRCCSRQCWRSSRVDRHSVLSARLRCPTPTRSTTSQQSTFGRLTLGGWYSVSLQIRGSGRAHAIPFIHPDTWQRKYALLPLTEAARRLPWLVDIDG